MSQRPIDPQGGRLPGGGGVLITGVGLSAWQMLFALIVLYLIMLHIPFGVMFGWIVLLGAVLQSPQAVGNLIALTDFIRTGKRKEG